MGGVTTPRRRVLRVPVSGVAGFLRGATMSVNAGAERVSRGSLAGRGLARGRSGLIKVDAVLGDLVGQLAAERQHRQVRAGLVDG